MINVEALTVVRNVFLCSNEKATNHDVEVLAERNEASKLQEAEFSTLVLEHRHV